MDDWRICGTARAEMEALEIEERFHRALRAMARGRVDEAASLAPAGYTRRSPGSRVSHEAVAYAHVKLAAAAGRDPGAIAERRAHLVARARELDAQIAGGRRESEHERMWLARAMAERADAALLLDEHASSKELYEGAIAILAQQWGDDHLEVASLLDDYATLLLAVGREADANAAIARAAAIATQHGCRSRDIG